MIHRTDTAYNNHGCHCDACTDAFTEYTREKILRRELQAPCSIAGCDGRLYSRGLCKVHFERQRTGRPPMDAPIRRRPGARGPQPGKRKRRRS
jgi:hypothetical protein